MIFYRSEVIENPEKGVESAGFAVDRYTRIGIPKRELKVAASTILGGLRVA